MLKIKNNVDLKEIGCHISDDDFDQIWSYKNVLFDKDTRIIFQNQFLNDWSGKRLDDLYDLIKDGLVVKVDD